MSSPSTSSFQNLSLLPRQVLSHYPRTAAGFTSVLCTCGLLWLVNVAYNAYERYTKLPNGPWGIPLIGYLPFMKKKKPTYILFHEMAKKYGPVFRFKLGGKHIVVISDWINMQDAFVNSGLTGRPEQTMFPGIINHLSFLEMSGNDWKVQRRSSQAIVDQILDSQERFEDRVKEEINRLFALIRTYMGAIDFGPKLARSLSNNITIILFGRVYNYEDPIKKELDEHIEAIFSEHRFAELLACAPWLAKMYLACRRANLDRVSEAVTFADRFFQLEVDRHLREVNLAIPEPRDYLDGYIKELSSRERIRYTVGDGGAAPGISATWNMETMKRNAFTYYCSATEKVTSTMLWVMFYLVSYPDMQERIRREIEAKIGFHREPEYKDRKNMPYTKAFLNEVHRMGSVMPVGFMRRARYDVQHRQYLIPKDTYVIFNLWSIHRDPILFLSPETFDPTRFLANKETEAFTPHFLVPYGDGNRDCPGVLLSNTQLFLYTVCILQKFRVKVAPENKISHEIHFRVSRRPARLPPLVFEPIDTENIENGA